MNTTLSSTLPCTLSDTHTTISSTNTDIDARHPHQLQPTTIRRCLDRVYHSCQRFRRHSTAANVVGECGARVNSKITIDSDSSSPSSSFDIDHQVIPDHSTGVSDTTGNYITKQPALNIIADKVSLPTQAGTATLLDVLPEHLNKLYSQPSNLLRPPAVKLHRRGVFMCSHSEYIELIKRMVHLDMISFTTSPLAVNGLFGVDKDNGTAIRLIIDARHVNSMFIPSPPVSLPTPALIASLHLPSQVPLYAAKVDLDNFYHRIRLPPAWWPYFALPSLRAGSVGLTDFHPDTLVYPCCTTLPMGFSHSVFLAQAIHEHLIDTHVPSLLRSDRIVRSSHEHIDVITIIDTNQPGTQPQLVDIPLSTSRGTPPLGDFTLNRMRHSVYIDDLNIYHTDPDIMNQAIDEYLAVMESFHLPAKMKKVVRPTSNGIECLGVHVDGITHEVGVSIPKLQALISSTRRCLFIGKCTGRELSHLIGRWTWAMLIRRPALSIFSAVYRFIECSRDSCFYIWPSVRRELQVACGIAPLLFSTFRCDWAPVILASDASQIGSGVTYTEVLSSVAQDISCIPSLPGSIPHNTLHSFIKTAKWKTAISHKWRFDDEHINGLEVRSALSSLRWCIKRPDVFPDQCIYPKRLLLLCDSSATDGSITKGRSSAYRILRPLRSLSSLLLVSGIILKVKWIPSQLNPADNPSRLITNKSI